MISPAIKTASWLFDLYLNDFTLPELILDDHTEEDTKSFQKTNLSASITQKNTCSGSLF
jgi:hypothetical protein